MFIRDIALLAPDHLFALFIRDIALLAPDHLFACTLVCFHLFITDWLGKLQFNKIAKSEYADDKKGPQCKA
jgi:hypothetical protein